MASSQSTAQRPSHRVRGQRVPTSRPTRTSRAAVTARLTCAPLSETAGHPGRRQAHPRRSGYACAMTTPDPSDTPVQEVRPDADTAPRPEEEVADAARQPAAGGDLGGEPAQGEGAADSY